MEEFTITLNNVEGSYYSFVVAVVNYVKKSEARFDTVKKYIENNPSATSSDILEFISNQDDFYDDAACIYVQVV